MKELFEEATGVYAGTLQEDMIDTVKKTKKLCCDVLIPQFFTKQVKYPLTYVPLWATVLPLKKGDKVLVTFNQGNLKYPILYKNASELEDSFFNKFNLPSNTLNAEETVSVIKIGVDSYLLKTNSYTVLRNGSSSCIILSDNETYVCGSDVTVLSTGTSNIKGNTVKIDGNNVTVKGNQTDIESSTGVSIKGSLMDLKTVLDKLLDGIVNSASTAVTAQAYATALSVVAESIKVMLNDVLR